MTDPAQKINIQGGVTCADFVGRDQTNISYGFSAEDVERLIEKVLAFLRAGAAFLPAPGQTDAWQIEHNDSKLIIRPGAALHLAGQRSERAYLLGVTIDQEYQRWARRFVPLAGKMDIRQVIEGLPIAYTELIIPTGAAGGPGQLTQRPLADIAEALQSHGALVILGDPGAGKTTTLQKIAFEAARSRLEGDPRRIPLFVRLSQQGERDPYAFLQTEWERRTATPFAEALAAGGILILADGINEIPRQQRNERLNAWRLFEGQHRGANQLIFSGREKDYDNQLNLPRVLVEPLDDERITLFLQRHNAEGLAELLQEDSRLGELARNPLNLFVLATVYLQGGNDLQVLANRGRLFQSFSLQLLGHEQLWHPDALSVDAKVELLARLAYDMQQQGAGTTFGSDAARQSIPTRWTVSGEEVPVDAAAFLRFGRGASILDPATLPEVRFYHHLLQEYFAARELLRRFQAGEDLFRLWQAPRLAIEMPAARVGEWDPLPGPPGTGWEVTTILACGLAGDPAALIEAVRRYNPTLAGRCLAEAGISSLHPDAGKDPEACLAVRQQVRADLLAELYNPAVHLRARLQAGWVLGKLGDPRFTPQTINGVRLILPTLVDVPAGTYLIGSSAGDPDANDSEKPQHGVELAAFAIGKWPVTNAEYACFMAAGGYRDEHWWQTDLAKRWLKGEDVAGGEFKTWLDIWKILQSMENVRDQLERTGNFTPEQIDYYEYIAGLTEEELKTELSQQLSTKSRREPAYWKDERYNNPSQPVVGITWFEAAAYCAWLSAGTGRPYRLPSEVEWEAAARNLRPGGEHGLRVYLKDLLFLVGKRLRPAGEHGLRAYPWRGVWEAAKANTLEGRVLKPSPVGAYAAAGGVGPFGAEDQAGNVYNWTSSLYLPYPYQAGQSELLEADGERVVRGGSWNDQHWSARGAYRNRFVPDNFTNNVGFRLVSPGILLNAGC